MKTTAQRICQKIELPAVPDGCWEWRGIRNPQTGYGTTKVSRDGGPCVRSAQAHRVSYELFVGRVPAGLQIDHLCRNRGCVNPAHLEAVTPRTNTHRGNSPSAECARQTHCKNGHPFDQANTYWRPVGGRPGRRCRICSREGAKRRYHAKRVA